MLFFIFVVVLWKVVKFKWPGRSTEDVGGGSKRPRALGSLFSGSSGASIPPVTASRNACSSATLFRRKLMEGRETLLFFALPASTAELLLQRIYTRRGSLEQRERSCGEQANGGLVAPRVFAGPWQPKTHAPQAS
jgi:hypothetical protein